MFWIPASIRKFGRLSGYPPRAAAGSSLSVGPEGRVVWGEGGSGGVRWVGETGTADGEVGSLSCMYLGAGDGELGWHREAGQFGW